MKSSLDYSSLLESYLELQNRVTRFSSVEQDLINTRDKLDHELILYKRLHTFSERSLKEMSNQDFMQLIAESIVDIFEVESAIVCVKDLKTLTLTIQTEGIDNSAFNTEFLLTTINSNFPHSKTNNEVSLLDSGFLKTTDTFNKFSRGLFAQFEDKEVGISVLIVGLVSEEFNPIYPAFTTKNQTIFGIFTKQLQSLFANRIKNQELKKTNSELDSFVYSVSHDLRAPLLSIKGILDLAFENKNLHPDINEYLMMAYESVFRLDNTIKEILEYSRNARLMIKPEAFDIAELVKDIWKDIKYSTDHPIDFLVDIDEPHEIRSDKARVKVLLNNIISNSVKYRKQNITNSYVKFSLKHKANKYVMSVEDNGEGIPDESRVKVFDMFYRASTTSSGTGLGLYISKEIVTKLNGDISLESTYQEGTTITIEIPNPTV